MDAVDILESMEAEYRTWGTAMVLHRDGITPDVTVYAKAFGAAGEPLVGSMDDTVRRIKFTNAVIATAVWPGPPRKGDLVGTYIIGTVDTRQIGELVVAHFCEVGAAL